MDRKNVLGPISSGSGVAWCVVGEQSKAGPVVLLMWSDGKEGNAPPPMHALVVVLSRESGDLRRCSRYHNRFAHISFSIPAGSTPPAF